MWLQLMVQFPFCSNLEVIWGIMLNKHKDCPTFKLSKKSVIPNL